MTVRVSHSDKVVTQSGAEMFQILRALRRVKRARSFRALSKLQDRRQVIKWACLLPFGIGLFFTLVIVMAITFGRSASSEEAENLLSLMLFVTMSTVLAGCLSTALQSLFMDRTIRYLVTLPIPLRILFYDKISDVAKGAIPGTLFGVTVTFGFVLGRAETYTFIALSIIEIVLLSATATLLSAAITALVVRFAPPRRVRAALTATSLMTLLLASGAWQYLKTANDGSGSFPSSTFDIHLLLPSDWAKEALVRSVSSQPMTALPFIGLQIGVLMLVAAGGATAFATTFSRNLERTDLRETDPAPRPAPQWARRILGLVPIQLMHWVKREWLTVGRDFARVSAASMPVASVLLWVISTLFWGGSSDGPTSAQFWMIHAPLLVLPWVISLGTTMFAFGAEGAAIGLLRSLPVHPATLMMGKYLAYAIPITGLSVAAGIVSLAARPGSPTESYILLGMIACLSLSFCAIDLALSAAAPKFDSPHVQRSTGFIARMLSAAMGLLTAMFITGGLALSPLGAESVHGLISENWSQPSPTTWIPVLAAGMFIPLAMFASGLRRLGRVLNTA